jgi:hypothetical protein
VPGAPAMPYLDDLLYGVAAGLQHEFPDVAPDQVASLVADARTPELGLLPDLPVYASAVATRARSALASQRAGSRRRM